MTSAHRAPGADNRRRRSPARIRAQVLRVLSHVFEAATAWFFVSVALAFFIDPTGTLVRSPVGQPVTPFDLIWNAFYLAGGVGVFVGLVIPSRRLELAGLALLGNGLLTAAVAVVVVNPDTRVLGYLGFVLAISTRSLRIVRKG